MSRIKFDEKTKLWSTSHIPNCYNPNISMGHILLRSMELNGPKIAQINDDTGEQHTFDELRLMSIRAAQNLQKRGYGSKHIFGVITEHVTNLSPIIIASLCLGAPISPMNTEWKLDTTRILKLIRADVIFCEARGYEMVANCMVEAGCTAKVFTFNGTSGNSEAVENLFEETGIEDDFIPVEVDGVNHTAVFVNTSGTTGPSKAIPTPHAALIAEVDIPHMGKIANSIQFSPCPIYWFSGLYTILVFTVNGSTRILTAKRFTPEMELAIIKKYNVSVLLNVSYELLLLLKSGLATKESLSSVKHVIGGGGKVPFAILQEFNSILINGHVNIDYGSTEIGAISFDFPYFSGKDSVGRLSNGLTVKIVDDRGNCCGINVDGEICAKSRYNFRGYYQNEAMTKEAIDSEGFFLTGDIGHIDEDGYLYIIDRKKNVIRHPKQYVFPVEIENFLLKSPKVKSVCVVGVPFDDATELPAAFVVRQDDSDITKQDIFNLIEGGLEAHNQLHGGIHFIDAIPLSSAAKPLRNDLKKMATELRKGKEIHESKNLEVEEFTIFPTSVSAFLAMANTAQFKSY